VSYESDANALFAKSDRIYARAVEKRRAAQALLAEEAQLILEANRAYTDGSNMRAKQWAAEGREGWSDKPAAQGEGEV
jgi:hypothetical protein